MPSPNKGCPKGACGSFILGIGNAILFILGLAGAITAGLVMGGGFGIEGLAAAASTISALIPSSFVLGAIIGCASIMLIAAFGLFGTCCQMSENKTFRLIREGGGLKKGDKEYKGEAGLKQYKKDFKCKDCVQSMGITIYIIIGLVGFIVLLIFSAVGAAVFAGVDVSELEAKFNSTGISVEGIYDTIVENVNDFVLDKIEENSDDWVTIQDTFGCCGWYENLGENTETGSCCNMSSNYTVINPTSLEVVGLTIDIDGTECAGVGEEVFTCGAVALSFAKTNLTAICIALWVFTFFTLVCIISAFVICCAERGASKKKKVASS